MPDLSNNSFIPKRGPATHRRSTASRQVYVFTLISYVAMFATLLAVGGVYFYSDYVDKQRDSEIMALNEDISSFKESDMNEVMEFDRRLQQAQGRIDHAVAMVSVFSLLEAATVDLVEIEALSIERKLDEKLVLSAKVKTDSFDSTLFQRKIYSASDAIDVVSITSLDTSAIEGGGSTGDTANPDENNNKFVTFEAVIEVPLSAVPYTAPRTSGGTGSLNDNLLQIKAVNSSSTEEIQTDEVKVNDFNI